VQDQHAPPLVLVIDDEPGIVDFMEVGLRDEGYRVASAATAGEGMRALFYQSRTPWSADG